MELNNRVKLIAYDHLNINYAERVRNGEAKVVRLSTECIKTKKPKICYVLYDTTKEDVVSKEETLDIFKYDYNNHEYDIALEDIYTLIGSSDYPSPYNMVIYALLSTIVNKTNGFVNSEVKKIFLKDIRIAKILSDNQETKDYNQTKLFKIIENNVDNIINEDYSVIDNIIEYSLAHEFKYETNIFNESYVDQTLSNEIISKVLMNPTIFFEYDNYITSEYSLNELQYAYICILLAEHYIENGYMINAKIFTKIAEKCKNKNYELTKRLTKYYESRKFIKYRKER